MTHGGASFVSLSDGGRLSYAVRGDLSSRTPILLNRPVGGSMALWGPFADRLAEAFPLIAFDPRGVGLSSDAPLRHSTRAMAHDAIELVDALQVKRVHVFGISLGGMVASWFAVDAPGLVSRMVLASTLPSARTVSRRILGELIRLGRSLLTPHLNAEVALVNAILSPEFCREHPDRVAAIDQAVRAHPAKYRNLVALALAAARHDAGACLERIRAPTLLLLGSRDPIAGMTSQTELVASLPHATLEMVSDSGHDVSLEQPEVTAARIVAFFERTSDSTGLAPDTTRDIDARS